MISNLGGGIFTALFGRNKFISIYLSLKIKSI